MESYADQERCARGTPAEILGVVGLNNCADWAERRFLAVLSGSQEIFRAKPISRDRYHFAYVTVKQEPVEMKEQDQSKKDEFLEPIWDESNDVC